MPAYLKIHRFAAIALLGFGPGPALLAESDMQGPEDALVSIEEPPGMGVGFRLQLDQRAIQLDRAPDGAGTDPEIDLFRTVVRIGGNPVPVLHLFGEAGWSEAEVNFADEGDGGVTWGVGLQSILVEHVIQASPVAGIQRSLSLAVEAQFRQVTSDLRAGDLEYDEVLVQPSLRYTHNRRGQQRMHPHESTGVQSELGLAFSTIDGDLGPIRIEEDTSLGLFLGTAFRIWDHWVTDLDAVLYGNSDFSLSWGLIYDF